MASKMPIPRLKMRPSNEGPPPAPRSDGKPRVSRACESCRRRKIRCNGCKPRCHNCLENEKPCVYLEGRKDRLKRTTELSEDMANFLKTLRSRVTDEDKRQIDDLLERAMDASSEGASSSKRPLSMPQPCADFDDLLDDLLDDLGPFTSIGAGGDMDISDDVMLRDEARATGYIGKNTATHWLRWLQRELAAPGNIHPTLESYRLGSLETTRLDDSGWSGSQQQQSGPAPVSISTFYLDDLDIGMDVIDPFELPPMDVAEKLIASYMDTVHESFPILSREVFMTQFNRYATSIRQGKPHVVGKRWQAILNLVFAIGTNYSGLVEAEWLNGQREGHPYHARARVLAQQELQLDAPPDVPGIQISALLALYYLVVGHISRAWIVVGASLRLAYSLGLHLHNETPITTVVQKGTLVQLWWGLYSLERTLSAITGRPSAIIDDHCSVPLPASPVSQQGPEESPSYQSQQRYGGNDSRQKISRMGQSSSPMSISSKSGPIATSDSASYLTNAIQIGKIAQRTIVYLYYPTKSDNQPEDTQQTISSLSKQLVAWATSLPAGPDPFRSNTESKLRRERFMLTIYYNSTKILITRPCLAVLDESQASYSAGFHKQMARECVNAAIVTVNLLSDDINTEYLYQCGPWWSIVHYLMQALAVVLLAIFHGPAISSHSGQDILPSAKKIIRWLRAMKENNQMAKRAYLMAFETLKQLASHLDLDISDLISEDAITDTRSPTLYPRTETASGPYEEGTGVKSQDQSGEIPTMQGDPLMAEPSGATWELMFTEMYRDPFATAHDDNNLLQTTLDGKDPGSQGDFMDPPHQ